MMLCIYGMPFPAINILQADTHLDAGGIQRANVTPCFVETFEVGVCRGPYTPELVRAWHKWDKAHGSENDPVDSLQV